MRSQNQGLAKPANGKTPKDENVVLNIVLKFLTAICAALSMFLLNNIYHKLDSLEARIAAIEHSTTSAITKVERNENDIDNNSSRIALVESRASTIEDNKEIQREISAIKESLIRSEHQPPAWISAKINGMEASIAELRSQTDTMAAQLQKVEIAVKAMGPKSSM